MELRNVCVVAGPEAGFAVQTIAHHLHAPVLEEGPAGCVRVMLRVQPKASFARDLTTDQRPEAYRLTIGPGGVDLVAVEPEGLLRAAASLVQLIGPEAKGGPAPVCLDYRLAEFPLAVCLGLVDQRRGEPVGLRLGRRAGQVSCTTKNVRWEDLHARWLARLSATREAVDHARRAVSMTTDEDVAWFARSLEVGRRFSEVMVAPIALRIQPDPAAQSQLVVAIRAAGWRPSDI
jgi:hypothetical protein